MFLVRPLIIYSPPDLHFGAHFGQPWVALRAPFGVPGRDKGHAEPRGRKSEFLRAGEKQTQKLSLPMFHHPSFLIAAILNYLGAGIRTEQFRSKPVRAPKGLGRGANATYRIF